MKTYSTIFFLIMFVALGLVVATAYFRNHQKRQPVYRPPDISKNLDQKYFPTPNDRAFGTLQPGEDYIDMHVYYRRFHELGWKAAQNEARNDLPKKYSSFEDVIGEFDAMEIGLKAFWAGYCDYYNK